MRWNSVASCPRSSGDQSASAAAMDCRPASVGAELAALAGDYGDVPVPSASPNGHHDNRAQAG
jgi:hypothetical protein